MLPNGLVQQSATPQDSSLPLLSDEQTCGQDDKVVELTKNLTATQQQFKNAQVGSWPTVPTSAPDWIQGIALSYSLLCGRAEWQQDKRRQLVLRRRQPCTCLAAQVQSSTLGC